MRFDYKIRLTPENWKSLDVLKVNKEKTCNDAISYFVEKKLYQEFQSSPANALLDAKFKLNNEILKSLKYAIDDVWMKTQHQLNQQQKHINQLTEQVKEQAKQIALVNKTLLAILEDKEED